ncbi:hypothetical protein H0H93_014365 [Arthromyces matolae]|nr:hypothetical protein H0H93_014365 [Arthromyces matolae]
MPSVPLEFDEEDEDFVGAGVGVGVGVGVGALLDIPAGEGASSSRETSQGGESGRAMTGTKVSTPATSEEDYYHDEVVEDSWGGWSEKDRGAVEEVERFDDIESDVLGLLDEEQQQRGRKRGMAFVTMLYANQT